MPHITAPSESLVSGVPGGTSIRAWTIRGLRLVFLLAVTSLVSVLTAAGLFGILVQLGGASS